MRNLSPIKLLAAIASLCIAITLQGLQSCKTADDDINPRATIKGTVRYQDVLTDSLLPLKGQAIYLAFADSSGYIISVQSDSSGMFYFFGLLPNSYRIYTSVATNANMSVPYYAEARVDTVNSGQTRDLALVATAISGSSHNNVSSCLITTSDASGRRVGRVTVSLYESLLVATADTSFSGSGSIKSLTTDSSGAALVVLPLLHDSLVYYKANLKVSSTNFRAFDTVVFRQATFRKKEIIIR